VGGTSQLWIIGAVMTIIACVLNTFGVHLQKYAHIQNSKRPLPQQRPYYTMFLWWAGFFLVLFGAIGDIAALAFAAQSLIAPLAGLTLVFNILIAPCFLEEKVTQKDIMATITIFFGCTVAVVFSNHEETVYTFSELVSMTAYEPVFITYFVLVMVGLVISFVMLNRFQTERLDDSQWYHENKEFYPPVVALLSGLAGAQAVTFAKGCMELIKAEIAGHHIFEKHFLAAPFCLVMLVIFLIVQLHFLNVGLAAFDMMMIFPLYQAVWILFTALGGIITYQEYRAF